MTELLEIFFKLLQGFVCPSDHSIDQNVSNLIWLSLAQLYSWVLLNSLPHPPPDDPVVHQLLYSLLSFEDGRQGNFAAHSCTAQLSLSSCIQAGTVLPFQHMLYGVSAIDMTLDITVIFTTYICSGVAKGGERRAQEFQLGKTLEFL